MYVIFTNINKLHFRNTTGKYADLFLTLFYIGTYSFVFQIKKDRNLSRILIIVGGSNYCCYSTSSAFANDFYLADNTTNEETIIICYSYHGKLCIRTDCEITDQTSFYSLEKVNFHRKNY